MPPCLLVGRFSALALRTDIVHSNYISTSTLSLFSTTRANSFPMMMSVGVLISTAFCFIFLHHFSKPFHLQQNSPWHHQFTLYLDHTIFNANNNMKLAAAETSCSTEDITKSDNRDRKRWDGEFGGGWRKCKEYAEAGGF